MDRIQFKEKMERDGFTVSKKPMAAGTVNQDHTHPFDARLFVLAGHVTLGQGIEEKVWGPSDICSVDADVEHSEKVDSLMDFTYLAALRWGGWILESFVHLAESTFGHCGGWRW